ncbi:hypothetical protein BJ875DRAFT_442045 [Amylocarpus encephaloides]|uniref:Uncharacterized protein n=1 Tax=Amylocarpus encephaloides TaxID=45428 RepID=A0A9P7YHB4_9HELO|nr:hypothetical protein BJ875DRAFT_442045 [Amylocarpus encephaloides]
MKQSFQAKISSKKFANALRDCGMKTELDRETVYDLVKLYSSEQEPIRDVRDRVIKLLNSQCRWSQQTVLTAAENSRDPIRTSRWLPVIVDGTMVLKAPNECRHSLDRILFSSQLPIFDVHHLSKDWTAQLGWDKIISKEILLAQLRYGAEEETTHVVSTVLAYMVSDWGISCADDLVDIAFVPRGNSCFMKPYQVFSPPKKGPSS